MCKWFVQVDWLLTMFLVTLEKAYCVKGLIGLFLLS